MDWTAGLLEWMTPAILLRGLRAALVLLVGWFLLRLVGRRLLAANWLAEGSRRLAVRGIKGLLFGLLVVWTLNELGFQIGPLLGAAGLFTVAIGFASQTAVSNLISGLFLVAEKPFNPGEVIQVGEVTGVVLAVDLMSTKLRTFDNQFVRLPNETLLKATVRNFTRYPIRRIDLQLGVAYEADLERVGEILMAVADAEPLCLDEPAPLVIFQGFGDSSQNLQFSYWAARETFLELRNRMPVAIKRRFDAEGIVIPFPQRVLTYGGPLPGAPHTG
jgi:small-conductance mechanosensitive channel